MPRLQELLAEVIEPLSAHEVEPIYSRVDEVRRRAIRAITEKFPEALRPEAKQVVPIKLLESRTYEGVLAASSWLTELILEGKVDDGTIESVYDALYSEYIHLDGIEDEKNKADTLDVRDRMGKIVSILKTKKIQQELSPTNRYIDLLEARYEYDFFNNRERGIEILEPLVAFGDERAVFLLGTIYESAGKYQEAKELYKTWAEKTKKPHYYKKLISVLWSLSEREAAQEYYSDYMILAGAADEEIAPLVVVKSSIDTDEDLSELGAVLLDIFLEKNFDPEYIGLLAKARAYVERELRESLTEMNKIGQAIGDRRMEFSIMYSSSHYERGDSDNLLSGEYDYLWIRVLFLYAINALVLFDNTPLRSYDLYSNGGDIVPSGRLTEVGKKMASESPESGQTREPIINPGKVEEFLDFLSELGRTEEGSRILTEFFSRYKFQSITRIIDGLEADYESSKKDRESNKQFLSQKGVGPQESKKDTLDAGAGGDELVPFSSKFRYSDLTILLDGLLEGDEAGEDDDGSESDEVDTREEEGYIGVLPGTETTAKTIPLEDILFFINTVYIAPEDRSIQQRSRALYEKYSEESGFPTDITGREFARMDTLETSLSLAGEGVREEYENIGKIIEEKYGPTLKKAIAFYAAESVTLKADIPGFLMNDYYLAWFLLVTHIFSAEEIDDDLVKDLLNQSVFHVDYLEGVDDLNSIIISSLVYGGLYDLACNFMIETRMVTNPPTFSLFLSCLSYLDDETEESFLDEIETEVLPEYEGVLGMEGLIDAIESDIEEGSEFESDDRVRTDLARAYLFMIRKENMKAMKILEGIDEKLDDDVPDMVRAEIEFAKRRTTIEEDISRGNTEVLLALSTLYSRLDFELKTECMVYMLRLSFGKETRDQFQSYLRIAIRDNLCIGLWKGAAGLLREDDEMRRESLFYYTTNNLTFTPVEIKKVLVDTCLHWKYQPKSVSQYGDISLQAAYILSNFPISGATVVDSIYQYSLWLNQYLVPKNGYYTPEEMEELVSIFEDSFGLEASSGKDIPLREKLSHIILRHFQHFCEEFTTAQKIHKKEHPKSPFPPDTYIIWQKTCRNFIEMIQRFQNHELEPVLADIRKVYHIIGSETWEDSFQNNLRIESQYIH